MNVHYIIYTKKLKKYNFVSVPKCFTKNNPKEVTKMNTFRFIIA